MAEVVDLPAIFRSIKKRWVGVLGLTILGVALMAGVTSRTPTQYASSVTFFVSTPTTTTAQLFNASQFGTDRVNSYVKLVSSDELARRIMKAQGRSGDPHQLANHLSATADLNTVLLTAQATGSTPGEAQRLASGIKSELGSLVQDLDVTPASKTPAVELTVVSGPTKAVQTEPKRKLNLAVGLLGGALVGLAWAVLRELSDTSIKSADQLGEVASEATLGACSTAAKGSSPLIRLEDGYNPIAEEVRQIRTSLQFINVDRPPKILTVSSAVGGDGKTTTAINLATVFAESGQRTLLVDADMRRGRMAEYLSIDGTVGLSDILANRVQLDDVLVETGPRSWVLPAGTVPPNPAELLDSQHMTQLLRETAARFDVVILDTPPLVPVTDGAIVAAKSDGLILVARYGSTKRAQVEHTMDAVTAVRARCLGWILNQVPRTRRDRSYYSYSPDTEAKTAAAEVRGSARHAGHAAAAEDGAESSPVSPSAT